MHIYFRPRASASPAGFPPPEPTKAPLRIFDMYNDNISNSMITTINTDNDNTINASTTTTTTAAAAAITTSTNHNDDNNNDDNTS